MPAAARMNRDEFYKKIMPLAAGRLRKVLWELYWRGTAPVRERVEAALEPNNARRAKLDAQALDGADVLSDVERFVRLARAQAYLGGTREVSPKERSNWRFTFRGLVKDAIQIVKQGDLDEGCRAVELLVGLAVDCKSHYHFRSRDPVEAMKLVVSVVVEVLWRHLLHVRGVSTFIRVAARHLADWEDRYGWTQSGYGATSKKERSLTTVLAEMLHGTDAWIEMADAYLAVLDERVAAPAPTEPQVRRKGILSPTTQSQIVKGAAEDRAKHLCEFNLLLVDRLHEADGGERLDRLVKHKALAGPETTFVHARLARKRQDLEQARKLIVACLEWYPGSREFKEFAREVGAGSLDPLHSPGATA